MLPFSLGLLLGAWLLHRNAVLPEILPLVGLAFLSALLLLRWPQQTKILAGVALGFVWAGVYAHWHAPASIPSQDYRTTYQASGLIRSLPERRNDRARVLMSIDRLEHAGTVLRGDWLVRVSWRDAPHLKAGQRWRLPLRLRVARSYGNPGGWDYAAWLYRKGVRYTAYVAPGDTLLLGESACCHLARLRGWLRERLQTQVSDDVGGRMLLALTLGDKSGLSSADKQVLALTGTSHLFVISGLHIGLAAAAFGAVFGWLWRRFPSLCGRFPALLAGAVAGMTFALLFALVSGFGIPAQRALVMLAAGTWVLVRRKRLVSSELFATALLAVLVWDPFAPMDAGFWLSFVAVAAILLMLKGLKGRHWLIQATTLQLGIALALYPVLMAFNMQPSPLGPVVNLLMVPLFGVFIVPASLLSLLLTLMHPAFGFFAEWMAHLLGVIHAGLAAVATYQPAVSSVGWSLARWILIVVSVLMILMPPGVPLRIPGLALLVAAHGFDTDRLSHGAFRATLLDVGQGLSMVVQTRSHNLVFDTGASYPSGFNLVDAVLLPYLRHAGISRVDRLILSHGDNDHAGGAETLVERLPVRSIREGEPWRNPVKGKLCRAGESWRWDGVEFTFINPLGNVGRKGNNASCVLLVQGKGGSLLIPGDIEERVERLLTTQLASMAPIDVVVAPHHGSLSSSSPQFVNATAADHVLFAVGHNNRYRFPRKEIVARWKRSGAKPWGTNRDGAIELHFDAQRGLLEPSTHASRRPRYWQHAR